MMKNFRLAIGNCSAKNPNLRLDETAQQTCATVNNRMQKLNIMSASQLLSFPKELEEIEWINGERVWVTTYHEVLNDDHQHLIVVQAFRNTLVWPTWISLAGIGQMVAEGIVISQSRMIDEVCEDALWYYR